MKILVEFEGLEELQAFLDFKSGKGQATPAAMGAGYTVDPTLPPFLTVQQVAERHGVSIRTIKERVAKGKHPRPVMIGGNLARYRLCDLFQANPAMWAAS